MASAKVLSAQEMDMSHGMQGKEMKGMKESKQGHASPMLVETPDVVQLPWRLPIIFPPLILLSGHSLSQETK